MLLVLALLALVVVLWATLGQWALVRHRLSWSAQRGLELLEGARSVADIEHALDRWEQETAPYWRTRLDDWVSLVIRSHDLGDVRVRQLLARASGFDYADRVADWRRWDDARERMLQGKAPVLPAREQVTLSSTWRALVGRTAWYSTILPLDGDVFVASLGRLFDDPSDDGDGIVRVDGLTGESELWFQPPDPGARDVIGIAAGRDVLFAASRNGYIYCVDRSAKLVWKTSAGSPIASIPVAADVNRDDVPDVIAITAQGRAAALNGASGKTLWVTPLDLAGRTDVFGGAGSGELRGVLAAISVGEIAGIAGTSLIVTTAAGPLLALNPANGRVQWRQNLDAGSAGGAIAAADGGSVVYLADFRGHFHQVVRAGRETSAASTWRLADVGASGVFAALRTVRLRGADGPFVLACTAGATNGSLQMIGPGGLRWRALAPGTVRATPAIADVNADGSPEVIVGSSLAADDAEIGGWLTIWSQDGHILRQEALASGVEASPVVADVDRDGLLDILVAERSGLMHCFATHKYGPVEWGLYAGDVHNTRNAANAYSFSQVPAGYQWEWRPKR